MMNQRGVRMDDEELCLEVLQDARWVRLLALIDSVIWTFALLFNPSNYHNFHIPWQLTAALTIMAYSGYYGAKNLQRPYVGVYIVCLIIEIFLEVKRFSYPSSGAARFLEIFVILIIIYVLRRAVKLVYVLSSEDQTGNPVLTTNDRILIVTINSYMYC